MKVDCSIQKFESQIDGWLCTTPFDSTQIHTELQPEVSCNGLEGDTIILHLHCLHCNLSFSFTSSTQSNMYSTKTIHKVSRESSRCSCSCMLIILCMSWESGYVSFYCLLFPTSTNSVSKLIRISIPIILKDTQV